MFYKSQRFGQLDIEKVLFEFEGAPIVFVCQNRTGFRFICVNTGYGYESEWLIAKTTLGTLMQVVKGKYSVLDAMAVSNEKILLLKEEKAGITEKNLRFEDINSGDLPDEDAKIHNFQLKDYYLRLQNESMGKSFRVHKIKKNRKSKDWVIKLVNEASTEIDLNAYRDVGRVKHMKRTHKLVEV